MHTKLLDYMKQFLFLRVEFLFSL